MKQRVVFFLLMMFSSLPLFSQSNNENVIYNYYSHIYNGELRKAYEMSPKNVPFTTFQGWYKEVRDIRPFYIEEDSVMDNKYNFFVVLQENDGREYLYEVQMVVEGDVITKSSSNEIEEGVLAQAPYLDDYQIYLTYNVTDKKMYLKQENVTEGYIMELYSFDSFMTFIDLMPNPIGVFVMNHEVNIFLAYADAQNDAFVYNIATGKVQWNYDYRERVNSHY